MCMSMIDTLSVGDLRSNIIDDYCIFIIGIQFMNSLVTKIACNQETLLNIRQLCQED